MDEWDILCTNGALLLTQDVTALPTISNLDHSIQMCPKRKFGGNPEDIFNATPEAIHWVKSLDIML